MMKILTGSVLAVGVIAGLALWKGPTPPQAQLAAAEAVAAPAAQPLAEPDPAAVRRAARRGLEWLRSKQDRASGGWVQDVGYKRGSAYIETTNQVPHVGVSALALMAFLAGGHLPGRGQHGDVVERGTNFILSRVDDATGFITGDGTRMYSHAFATLFLTQIYGMTHRADLREKLQQAVDLTVDAQNDRGGWRYAPYSPRADMSITVCQIMALRAARNVGIKVPKSTISRAYEYVDGSAYKRRNGRDYGGFRYKIAQTRSRTTFPLTAAGVATLNHSGIYEHGLIDAGISYLERNLSSFNSRHRDHYFYWYGHYYASQVFFLSSDGKRDRRWKWYWGTMAPELIGHQSRRDGSWANRVGPGRAFSTAVACIILQIPYRFLPIFAR